MSPVRPPHDPVPLPPHILERARQLRRNLTDAEQYLWYLLRRKQLGGFRFRRQHPFLGFFLDYYCAEGKLVVELDGGQHGESVLSDERRSAALQRRGIEVMRVWNNELFENTEGVLQTIYGRVVERVSERRGVAPPP